MADIAFETLTGIRRRTAAGETTIEDAASSFALADLADALRMTRGTLQALADGWTQQQLAYRPTGADAKSDWSATMALSHLIVTENWYLMHMGRLQERREQFDAMPRGLGDQADPDVPKDELAAKLRGATERILTDITSIPADADLTATRDSTFFGGLSLRGWVLLACLHDVEHLEQIQRVTEDTGFPTA